MGWGRDSEKFLESPRLNPIALIEVTYNFVLLFKELVSYFDKKPSKVKLIARFKNVVLDNGKKVYLNTYNVGIFDWEFDDDK